MRWISIAAFFFLAFAASAAEEGSPNKLERLEQLVNKVEAELKTAAKMTRQDAGREPSAQAEASPLWQDIEWDIIEMRHVARQAHRRAACGGATAGLVRSVNAFSSVYGDKRGKGQAPPPAASLAQPLSQVRAQLEQFKANQAKAEKKAQAQQPPAANPQKRTGNATLEELERLFNQVASKARARVGGKKQKSAPSYTNNYFYNWEQRRAVALNTEKAKLLQSQKAEAATQTDELADLAFRQDLLRLRNMAQTLQDKALRQGAKNINLMRSVKALSDACGANRKRILGTRFSLKAALAQMRQQLDRLSELETDVPSAVQDDSARQDRSQWRAGGELETLDDQALTDKLWERRRSLLKADRSFDSLAPATVDAYINTLTASQGERFESLWRTYADAGFSTADAKATALLELHIQWKKAPDKYDRKEVESILNRPGNL